MRNTASRSIMIQGTGSGVGKSVLVAALCRIFSQDGYSAAPFKAQNMALNSFVTIEDGEIGRAQAVQAQAAGIEPSVDMNPILLKPTTDTWAQVIVRGKPAKNLSAKRYTEYKKKITGIVDDCYRRLAKRHEIIVIEGAGSPAEINLRSHDIVNMRTAFMAKAPVILAGDIDKGGVFAWLIGTLHLLTKKERGMVKGFIINKFRGDINLLESGLRFLERRTGIDVLGVVPFFRDIKIPEEDSVFMPSAHNPRASLNIAVIRLPHISNFTDFDVLDREGDVNLSFADDPADLNNKDAVIIPGSKNTISDMDFLRRSGFEKAIRRHVSGGKRLVGICGGFQMLGKRILDSAAIESKNCRTDGFGIFDFETVYHPKKVTKQIEAVFSDTGEKIKGYEIHHGRIKPGKKTGAMFNITRRGAGKVNIPDGAFTKGFAVWGTHIHGIFDNGHFRRWFLNGMRKTARVDEDVLDLDREYDKLADVVRKSLDIRRIYKELLHLR